MGTASQSGYLAGKGRMGTRTSGWLDTAIRAQLNWSNLSAERERQLLRVCQTDTDMHARRVALTDLW